MMRITSQVFASLRFCPWCSTETLTRDNKQLPDWTCSLCGISFTARPSKLYEQAVQQLKTAKTSNYCARFTMADTLSPTQVKELEASWDWQRDAIRQLRGYLPSAFGTDSPNEP